MKSKPRYTSALLSLSILLPALCIAQGRRPTTAETTAPSESAPAPSAAADASAGLFVKSDSLRPVYFASGASGLDPTVTPMLKDNADWLKRNLPQHILVAGYSDGRGTPEQNLSMGQRRAAALRDFYVAMGIPRSRISTVSYGQEEPVCFEATDECQALNRRVDTLIENKELASR